MTEPYSHFRNGRVTARPARAGDPPRGMTVDMHSHAGVQAAADLARPHAPSDPRGKLLTEETQFLTRKQDTDRTPNRLDLNLRVRDFRAMDLDAPVISRAPGLCHYSVPPDMGVKVARLANEGIAAIMAREKAHIPAAVGSVPRGADGTAAAEKLE